MKIYLFLIFIQVLVPEHVHESEVLCKKVIPESYDVQGFLIPKSGKMYLCPNITNSCCSTYDQFIIYEKWNKDTKDMIISE